jgi:hypothetical protein
MPKCTSPTKKEAMRPLPDALLLPASRALPTFRVFLFFRRQPCTRQRSQDTDPGRYRGTDTEHRNGDEGFCTHLWSIRSSGKRMQLAKVKIAFQTLSKNSPREIARNCHADLRFARWKTAQSRLRQAPKQCNGSNVASGPNLTSPGHLIFFSAGLGGLARTGHRRPLLNAHPFLRLQSRTPSANPVRPFQDSSSLAFATTYQSIAASSESVARRHTRPPASTH